MNKKIIFTLISCVCLLFGAFILFQKNTTPQEPIKTNDNISTTPEVTEKPPIKEFPILMYHCISEPVTDKRFSDLYVPPERFKQQMEYLKAEGFSLITFNDIENINQYEKPILVTLDDGYADNMNVYNTLKELTNSQFKPKATIFMIADAIGAKGKLTASQIKEISDSDIISVQSHTYSHADLRLESNDYEKELKKSKEIITSITNKEIIALAYPYGLHNARAIEEAKKQYTYAVTILPGKYTIGDDKFTMKRIDIKNSVDMEQFKKAVQ